MATGVGELGRQQQAEAAHRRDAGERRQAGGQPLARGRRPGPGRPRASITCEHGAGRGGGQGLAAEGRGVVAGHEGVGHVGPGPAGADGHAVAEGLGHGDDVGPHAEVLEAEPLAGAAEAGLHLVDDEQQRRARRRGGARPAKYSGVAGLTPPSPCTGSSSTAPTTVGSMAAVQGVEVVPGHVAEALGQGLERLVLLGLAGGGSVARVRPWNEP